MKPSLVRPVLFLILCALSVIVGIVHSASAGMLSLFGGSLCLLEHSPELPKGALFTVTLTPTLILQQTIKAFAVRCPFVLNFASEFTTERLKKDQQVIGKIRVRPVASTYDANSGGYKAGAQESRDLLLDVPFVMDQHRHVTVKLSHLYAIKDSLIKLQEHFADSASVLGKGFADYLLGKVDSAAFSNSTTLSAANSNRDMLNTIRIAMNKRGVQDGRFAVVNSDVSNALDGDSRITNRYSGGDNQNLGDQPFLRYRNLAGFTTVDEYPDLPTNTGTILTGITGVNSTDLITKTAHGLLTGQRICFPALTGGSGLTAGAATGTSFYYAIKISADTFKVATSRANAIAGTAADLGSDISDGSVQLAENVSGFLGTREAICMKTGLPTDGIEACEAFGIPARSVVGTEVVTDMDSGLSMVGYKWFETGSMDGYMTIAFLYGAVAGAQGGAAASLLEPAGHILRTA